MYFKSPSEFITAIHRTTPISSEFLRYIEVQLRFCWPGDYHIEQLFEKEKELYTIKIVFHNPLDETLWWLKNS